MKLAQCLEMAKFKQFWKEAENVERLKDPELCKLSHLGTGQKDGWTYLGGCSQNPLDVGKKAGPKKVSTT